MGKVGVEQSLQNVVQVLKEKGHDVVELKSASDANGCDCFVVTGMDSNFMGIHDTSSANSIIDASGRNADEVCQEVESRLNS